MIVNKGHNKKLLFIANDVIGDTTAGPGIRYIELGREMVKRGYAVTVLGKSPRFTTEQLFVYAALTPFAVVKHIRQSDCVIVRGGGPLTTLLVMLFGHGKDIIADVYSFTQFEVPHTIPRDRRAWFVNEVRKAFHAHKLRFYGRHVKKFWVANERQRDFLAGLLYAEKNFDGARQIAIVPFGCPAAAPVKRRPVLKGVVEGIGREDFVLIWGGGVWDWLDPLTLVRAMALIRPVDPGIKLYFMGVQAPSGYIPEQAVRLIALSRDLGMLDKTVFIHRAWIPYHDRTEYLLEADAGVSLHPHSLETHYSFRTRILDYLYCGLPMVHTDGDVWADRIQQAGLGIVVPAGNERAVADAILRLRRDPALAADMKISILDHVVEFTWEHIAHKAQGSIEAPAPAPTFFLRKVIEVAWSYLLFSLQTMVVFFKLLFKRQSQSKTVNGTDIS